MKLTGKMSTVFISVQCYQCSTMQVKQRKKSSNKWNCVVCNEKQSIRKVFFQGLIAKDVRKFVQSFNMSRHFIEQQPAETLAQLQTEIQANKRRTNWSEYVHVHIDDFGISDDKEEMCEANVVTELPELLFKKPKLKSNYYSAAVGLDGEELHRPVFGKRNVKKKFDNPESGKEIVKGRAVDHSSVMKPNSKWNGCHPDTGSSSVMVKLKRPVSKWNNFIDDDNDDDESRFEEMNDAAAFETKVSDEIVEDDVHPHFMSTL